MTLEETSEWFLNRSLHSWYHLYLLSLVSLIPLSFLLFFLRFLPLLFFLSFSPSHFLFLLVTRFRCIHKHYIVLTTMKYKYYCNYFYNLRNWVSETLNTLSWVIQYTQNSKPRLKDSKVHDHSILSVCFWYCSWSDCWKMVMCFGVY